MNSVPDESQLPVTAPRAPAVERAVLSLVVPGLGQFAQGRFLTGAGQLGTVLTYATTALALGGGRALLLAITWNIWSAVDAYRAERR
jgi:TM2 domain-containing membrane protein YozV